MKKHVLLPVMFLVAQLAPVSADEGNEAIDYQKFVVLTSELAEVREKNRISEERFLELSGTKGVVVLDSRSKAKFDQLHVKGAVHLNFSDFTAESLGKLIPDKNTTILIYCNNNFEGEKINFPGKKAEVALNIPTFVNLHAYGYKNVYELKPLLDIKKTKILFSGLSLSQKQG